MLNEQQFGYHAAPDWARRSIERHGLDPTLGQPLWEETEDHNSVFDGDAGYGYGRGVYMFNNKERAQKYASGMERMSRSKRPADDNLRLHEPTNFDVWEADVTEGLKDQSISEDPDSEAYVSHVPLHDVRRLPRGRWDD